MLKIFIGPNGFGKTYELEKIKNDMYIISSYLIDDPGYLQDVLKEYNKYKKVS